MIPIENKIAMSQYLLSSSHTWVCKEMFSDLNPTIMATYLTLQLKEQQDTIKIEENSSDTGEEDETLNISYESMVDGNLSKSNYARVHSDGKSYKCNECNKMFTRSSNLKDHKVIHSNIVSCMFANSTTHKSSSTIIHLNGKFFWNKILYIQ